MIKLPDPSHSYPAQIADRDGRSEKDKEEGFLTTKMLMQQTGITLSKLKSLSALGSIKCVKRTHQGWSLYDQATAQRIIDQRLGEAEAERPRQMPAATTQALIAYSAEEGLAVFRLLKEKKNLDEVFLETKIHPLILRTIANDYDLLTGSFFLTKDIVDSINNLGNLDGKFPLTNALDLYAVLKTASEAKEERCVTCKKKPPISQCATCARNTLLATMRRDFLTQTAEEITQPPEEISAAEYEMAVREGIGNGEGRREKTKVNGVEPPMKRRPGRPRKNPLPPPT